MRKHKINNVNGITLIALVVTIIVLLILAGISIMMLTGDNGILQRAGQAKTMTDEAQIIENIKLAYNNSQIGRYTNSNENFASTMQAELEKTYGTGNATVTDNGDGTLTITVNGKIYDIDGDGNAKNHISKIPTDLKIGSTVTYKPSGTFTWEAELCSSIKTPIDDDVILQTVSSGSVTSGNADMSITSWKVLSIDEENEKVELISTSPSLHSVYLGEAQGYNNAVYLLNNACDKLYGGTITKGGVQYTIEGRNLNIKDIEDRMTTTALSTAHSYGTNSATYGHQYTSAHTNRCYPLIYEQEYNSVINGNINTSSTLDVWTKQITPIHRTDSVLEPQAGVADSITKSATAYGSQGFIQANTNIQPYQTYWYKDNSFMKTAFKAPKGLNETDGDENTNYNLLMTNGSGITAVYWLASRNVDISMTNSGFSVGGSNGGNYSPCTLFASEYANYSGNRPLRPVVSLNAELISKNESNEFVVE